jgi:glycosyltransferase involved in cell wall biosynthesis
MNATPKVSVLIPTYNYAHFLDETIQSVLDQTFTDFELIIVDNCSTDNTAEVVQKYLADTRVLFYRNETNIGLVGNWNKCLEYAKGEYIKCLCADDKFHPQLLEKFVAVMDQHTELAIVSSYTEIFGRNSRIRKPPFEGQVNGQTARESLIKSSNWLYAPTASMFRKISVEKVGNFNPALYRTTDKEFFLRLLTTGDCYIIPEALSSIRSHSGSATTNAQKKEKEYENMLEGYRYINILKKESTPITNLTHAGIDELLKTRATSCAAVMYKLIPKLYKKKNRKLFKEAFRIAKSEGVLLDPWLQLINSRKK